MIKLKYAYGIDDTKQGFFWPESVQKRKEWLDVKRNSPMEAESVYQCNPGAREGTVFLESDFTYYQAPDGLSHGVVDPKIAEFCNKGVMVVQGWDTGMSAKSSSDPSVCITAMFAPSDQYHRGEDPLLMGECEPHFMVYLLDVFKAQLDIGDLIKAAREQYLKWQPQLVVIEKKAHGSALIQALEFAGIPMEAVDPVDSKRERTVTAIGQAAGSVQGWFRLHRVRAPAEAEWLEDYKRELKDFSGQKGGKDDQVDATVHVVSYGIREGGSGVTFPTGWQTPEEVDRQMAVASDPTMDFWARINDPEAMSDPFEGVCGRCINYTSPVAGLGGLASIIPRGSDEKPSFCRIWNTHKSSIESCDSFSAAYNSMIFPRR